MFNDNPIRWGTESYYSVEVATILPILVFSVLAELKKENFKQVLAAVISVLTLCVTLYKGSTGDYAKYNFIDTNFYRSEYPAKEINHAISGIPDDAIVCASSRILPHLALRENIYHFPRVENAEYVCIAKIGSTFPISQEEYDKHVQKLLTSNDWKIVVDKDNFLMLKRIRFE
jgi:hypothetical protein